MSEPTVFIVDDDSAVRRFLRGLITSVGLRVEEYSSATKFLDGFEPGAPGCLLLDIRMPGMSGLELQRELVDRAVRLPIIILTGHADVEVAVHAMKAGAVDFVEKPFNNEFLLNRIQTAVTMSVATHEADAKQAAVEHRVGGLSRRERQVLDFVVEGETNKSIGGNLGISEKTVEIHRAKMMEKMKVSSLADLVRTVAALDTSDTR
jgi:two-component system, LuxR family, response regulator FixJ